MIQTLTGNFDEYLKDESRNAGTADFIAFPKTVDEVRLILIQAGTNRAIVTVQGSRTGITAGAVPDGGYILNLSMMNNITGLRYDSESDSFFLKLQPGVILSDLRDRIADKNFETKDWTDASRETLKLLMNSDNLFFSPDPTETSASIGGMAACNASGACSYFYGPTRKFIESMEIVLADGSLLQLSRGNNKAVGYIFELRTLEGKVISGKLPSFRMPAVKNAAGYFTGSDMDMLDLFIGSEGTLGVVTELEIRLLTAPVALLGVMSFFFDENNAIEYVSSIRTKTSISSESTLPAKLVAIEYFGKEALDLLREQKNINPAFSKIPDIPIKYQTGIYTEYHGDSEHAVYDMVIAANALMVSCGGSDDDTWIAGNKNEMDRLHFFRHAVPEAVNLIIDKRRKKDPDLKKLGTDMAVPDYYLRNVFDIYRTDIRNNKLDAILFGHIGDNHIHINILPDNKEEYEKGCMIYLSWAEQITGMGGTISAEHGVGKTKTKLLEMMYGSDAINEMRKVKETFDPNYILNRGNIFCR